MNDTTTKNPETTPTAAQPLAAPADGNVLIDAVLLAAPATNSVELPVDASTTAATPSVDNDQPGGDTKSIAVKPDAELELGAATGEAAAITASSAPVDVNAKQTSADSDEPDQTSEADSNASPDLAGPVDAVAVVVAPVVNSAPVTDALNSKSASQSPTTPALDALRAVNDTVDEPAGSAGLNAEGEAVKDGGETKPSKALTPEQPVTAKANPAVDSKPVADADKNDQTQGPQTDKVSRPADTAASHEPAKAVPSTATASEKPALPQHDLKLQRDGAPTLKTTSDQPQPFVVPPAGNAVAPDRTAQVSPAPQAVALPVAGIAVEIASKAFEGKNRFEIRLDPPELGRIHVRLDVDRNGEITSRVMTDRQDTLDLFRRDAPALERALQDAGLKTANNGLQFSLRDHGPGHQDRPLPVADHARLVVTDESLAVETVAPAYRALVGNRAGVDIRV